MAHCPSQQHLRARGDILGHGRDDAAATSHGAVMRGAGYGKKVVEGAIKKLADHRLLVCLSK
jgi:hypothetical protein